MAYRFVVCIDIENADSLEEAYRILRDKMGEAFENNWESTDEAYDENGDEIPVDELTEMRVNFVPEESDIEDDLLEIEDDEDET